MKLKLQFIIAAFVVLVTYIPVAHGQANLTFSGGGNVSPLSITLQQSVKYTITDSDCITSGTIFVFDEAGNPFVGSGAPVSGTIAYSINGGNIQPILIASSGVNASNVSANDIFVYGNLTDSLSIGSTVILSAGTVTTNSNVSAAAPDNGSFITFLTNSTGDRCSDNGVALAPTAASVSISGRVSTSSGRGLSNALVHLTDQEGNTRTIKTNSFGYYHFDDVQAGQTATLTVVSKRYQFSPKILNIGEDLSQMDFIAGN